MAYSAKRKDRSKSSRVSWSNDNKERQSKRRRMGFASMDSSKSTCSSPTSMVPYASVNEMSPLKSDEQLKSDDPTKSEEETFNLDSDSLKALEKLLGDDEGTELDECPDEDRDSGKVTALNHYIDHSIANHSSNNMFIPLFFHL